MRLQTKHARQVLLRIIDLGAEPFAPDTRELRGALEGHRRATSGEYRIIYRVEGDHLLIATVGRRNDDEVYRGFERKQK